MKTQNEFIEFGKEKLKQWKTILEDLEVQLTLGKAEFKDAFEQEKKRFNAFVQEHKNEFSKAKKVAETKHQLFSEKLDLFGKSLDRDLLKAKTTYARYKKDILYHLHQLELVMKDSFSYFDEEFQSELNQFKEELDSFRIEFTLGDFDTQNEREESRIKMKDRAVQLRESLVKKEMDDSKIDRFVDEISESFNHLKNAFSDLVN